MAQINKLEVTEDKVQKERSSDGQGLGFGWKLFLTIFFILTLGIGLILNTISKNKFKRQALEIETSVSSIDVYLRQRYDMLTKMIDGIKGSMKFEKETLAAITAMRTGKANAAPTRDGLKGLESLDNNMQQVTAGLNLQMERYPDIKSSALVSDFMGSSERVENELAAARRIYNKNVKRFNMRIETFPSNIVGKQLNLESWKLYQVADYAKKDVKVDFKF